MAGAGYWRNRYAYEEPVRTVDSAGEASLAWRQVAIIAGSVTPSQREYMYDLGMAVRTDLILETAFHPSVSATGRLTELSSGRVFNISSVVDPDGGKRKRLRVMATEVAH